MAPYDDTSPQLGSVEYFIFSKNVEYLLRCRIISVLPHIRYGIYNMNTLYVGPVNTDMLVSSHH